MLNIKVKYSTVILAVLAMGFVYLLGAIIFPSKNVPSDFSEARRNGAAVAERILELSRDTLGKLNQIEKLDRDYNYSEALLLISQKLIDNRENNMEAVKLSSQLERMARLVTDIYPTKARNIATEGITAEVAAVSHLLSYNEYLNQLFEILKNKFEKPWVGGYEGQVKFLVNKVNDEVLAINELNGRFTASMIEFDRIMAE